jgi:NAD(P)-dependent dehydrogenase (short-subunit alcohol dehydrogenase family)
VWGLTTVAGLRYAKRNIRVNAIAPGNVRTGITERAQAALPPEVSEVSEVSERRERIQPIGRLIDPEEIAEFGRRDVTMAEDSSICRLDGRRIIITGGASGMGESMVRAFPGLGADVVSLDVNENAGTRIAKEAGARFVTVDVRDADSTAAAFTEAVGLLGGLDVLVHAAAIAPSSPAETTSVELFHQVVNVNTLGTMLTNQAAFRYMKDTGGTILNFASAAGVIGQQNKSAYSMSKGAVVAWTRTAAREWARHDIRVNMIAPAIWTPMYDRTRSEMSPDVLAAHDEQMKTAVPLGGRLGDARTQFIPVMAFYASAGASFLTGQLIPIDGGVIMPR